MELVETLVIVGVVVAIALALAFFASSMVSQNTGVEQLDIQYVFNGSSKLTIHIRNRGTQPTSVTLVKVDGRAYPQSVYIQPGGTATVTVEVEGSLPVHEVVVVTSSGTEYARPVKP
ncbi:hypothetical protein [Infirmifilum sp. SLHALR2]|nr:MAG: hypothetical protein B7L53_04295 [Thermofilum sp. NZ13]